MIDFDVIVIGAGHAGCEASLAAAKMGANTLLLTINREKIAEMSCNPSIGGLAKGQLVKEIDALGGQMGRVADQTAIQYRVLNMRKGPAVRSTRIQSDKELYRKKMSDVILNQKNLQTVEDEVLEIVIEGNEAKGIKTKSGKNYKSKILILTPGTFLNGLVHIGDKQISSGRDSEGQYEPASKLLANNIKRIGFKTGRLKTGTVPRLLRETIDFKRMQTQWGDENVKPISFFTKKNNLSQVPCHITYTNKKTHKIVKDNLKKSALYGGNIEGTGARYCPSLEDKLVRFADKERHQVFIEPEGLDSNWIYPNGISNSLPQDIQEEMVHSIEGLENAKIERPGYAIEYDFINPIELFPWLETKKIKNLFFAGQINGTSGYEEAAAQGLIAGINAVHKIKSLKPYIVKRSKGYIGVLIDDLVTKGTNEPYRMFTSRAEYRLVLREDNADRRLCEDGYKLGLLDESSYEKYRNKLKQIDELEDKLSGTLLNPTSEINSIFEKLKETPMKNSFSLKDVFKRPGITFKNVSMFADWIKSYDESICEQVEIDTKYAGYIKRQNEEIERFKKLEDEQIPVNFDYSKLSGLTNEVKEKLSTVKPVSLGQASRISGVTPAAISILMINLRRNG